MKFYWSKIKIWNVCESRFEIKTNLKKHLSLLTPSIILVFSVIIKLHTKIIAINVVELEYLRE